MNNDLLIAWSLNFDETLKETVEKNFPSEKYRWPMSHSFQSKGFIWKNSYLIIILYDKGLQIPDIGLVENLTFDLPFEAPSSNNIREIHKYLFEKFSLRQNDGLLIVPITEGRSANERFE